MARDLSTPATEGIFAQQTGQMFLLLVVVNHAEMSAIRLVQDEEDVVSNGETYTAFAFMINLPDATQARIAKVKLVIDNTDGRFTSVFRSIRKPFDVTVSVVLRSSPDTIEAGPFDFVMRNISRDAQVIQGECTFEPIGDDAFPKTMMESQTFPGLF